MRLRLNHPQDSRVATVGHDRTISWYAEVRSGKGRLIEEYDQLTVGEPTTLAGVLRMLVQHEFFSQEDLEYGLSQTYFGYAPSEVEDVGARFAMEVVETLKQGANG